MLKRIFNPLAKRIAFPAFSSVFSAGISVFSASIFVFFAGISSSVYAQAPDREIIVERSGPYVSQAQFHTQANQPQRSQGAVNQELSYKRPPFNFRNAGLEVLAYPAGVITTVYLESPTYIPIGKNEGWTWAGHVGFNTTDRGSWGEHDEETGGGFGVGARLTRYFPSKDYHDWFVAGRLDFWNMSIDWEDDDRPDAEDATTTTWTMQPTVNAGVQWTLERWMIRLNAGFGAELNISTTGEDVGEGLIGLLGGSVGYRF